MKRIWSPWRIKYFSQVEKGCVFCNVQEMEDGTQNLVVQRGSQAFVILNLYPYTSGHLMVVANAHVGSMEDLDRDARSEMMELATKALGVLREVYHPQGFNMGVNIGEVAGAGITGHVHLHVVPRWGGDTNFMTTLGTTRVLPEALEDTYQRIRDAWLKG